MMKDKDIIGKNAILPILNKSIPIAMMNTLKWIKVQVLSKLLLLMILMTMKLV